MFPGPQLSTKRIMISPSTSGMQEKGYQVVNRSYHYVEIVHCTITLYMEGLYIVHGGSNEIFKMNLVV